MTEKYCDHGLYGAAVVTANTTNANATLTVTAVTSGRLGLGALISGTNIPANSYISALGTGKGGAGTYTMSINATGTATGTTITASMGGPALEPEWNVAQEGDGTAIGAATPATVSIDMASMTAAVTNTIAIGGAVLTCVASGATTNQFNAGTGATLVDNIVAAINRTTNTSAIAAAATGWGTPKIQDAVFARKTGTAILEIMYRAGSATHNANSLSQVALSGFTGGAGPYTFSSGAGGAWGCYFNRQVSIFPSGIAAYGYGILAAQQPTAGVQLPGDLVNIRSGKRLPVCTGAHASVQPPALGSLNNPVIHKFDNSTVWSDGAAPAFIIDLKSGGSNYSLSLVITSPPALIITGFAYSNTSHTLRFDGETQGSGGFNITLNNNSKFEHFDITATVGGTSFLSLNQNTSYTPEYANLYFKNITGQPFFYSNGNYTNRTKINNAVIDNYGATVPHSGVIGLGGLTGNLDIQGLKCLNFVAGSRLMTTSIGTAHILRVTDAEFNNVTSRGPYYASNSTKEYSKFWSHFSSIGNRDFLIDYERGLVEWNSSQSYPTLSATLPDGVTNWSWKIAPPTVSGYASLGQYLDSPRIAKINSLADGARTFALQLCISDALSWTKRDVSMRVVYKDVNGDMVTLDTLDYAAGALTSSSETWSQESGGKVTYSDGGTLYHNKFKLEVSTPSGKNLPAGAEVGVYFRVHNTVANSTQYLFVDPDVSIA